jgi:hypothetical protein
MSFSVDSFSLDAWAGDAFALNAPSANVSFSAAAFSVNAFSTDAFAFDTPSPVVVTMDTHDGNLDYRKRREQHAELRAMIEEAFNGPAVLPALVKVREIVKPYRTETKIDLTGARESVIARLEKAHAEYMRQLEADDEETLLMVLH